LQIEEEKVSSLSTALLDIKEKIHNCRVCNGITEDKICSICTDPNRDSNIICVVENSHDIIVFEKTNGFNGKYHVLGGVISPMDGIGPSDLNIESLVNRIKETPEIKEVLLALRITMEGDTTNFFLYKKLKDLPVKITTIARGISFGEQIEYTDEITLAKSILNRVPYEI